MRNRFTLLANLVFISFGLFSFELYTDKQVLGSWKHYDVTNRLGAHATIELEPFDLMLSKDHHFEMTGQGMRSTGTWTLKNDLLTLDILASGDRPARVQKLYISKVEPDVLIVEVKDFEVPGGLLIVMHRMK